MRCAIYTRKSTEEGLAQEFNSLDAQREAAEAYILSQREAEWVRLPQSYDDGGFTGANLERPALRRLLADIEEGLIDCVIVYKVDRLSRSLLDFSRLMGAFEKRGIHFISVTQQFNTTASLGRLTLNILLSFAQFEREIIAERTRDKMSAARRKGKWTGGVPVLGYDIASGGRKLVINEGEAIQVRRIFDLYSEHPSLEAVLTHIQQQGWATKRWVTGAGKSYGGRSWTPKDVLVLLRSSIYTGRVYFQGQHYAGEHRAIVEESAWTHVQSLLDHERSKKQVSAGASRKDRVHSSMKSAGEQAPRITRLLALALKFERLIHEGVVKDYAELARLGQVSRARITQIMNLLNLSSGIQEEILSSRESDFGKRGVRETTVRKLSSEVCWSRQQTEWEQSQRRCKSDVYPVV